jgi:hypothetical protein
MKNTKINIFNEQSLRKAIAETWGEHGAHIEVFDMLLGTRSKPRGYVKSIELPSTEQQKSLACFRAGYIHCSKVFRKGDAVSEEYVMEGFKKYIQDRLSVKKSF